MAAIPFTVTASPANATWADCYNNSQFCLYEDAGSQGDEYGRKTSLGDYELGGWNGDNEISAIANYSAWCATIYSNDGQKGRTLTVRPGRTLNQLKDWDFNDDAESYRLHRCV
ncbi:peptidase inhibitor family I36 protein [Nonomuraea roseola]|uniref:Peptidase inhibitor family I36 protein n=1 Tax=Nonomuraea roseola TaxID=46179 RepID=A0ABV5PWV3_9ACTN